MNEEMQKKMETLMYALTKHAARNSFTEFLEDWALTIDDYDALREVWIERLGIKNPYL